MTLDGWPAPPEGWEVWGTIQHSSIPGDRFWHPATVVKGDLGYPCVTKAEARQMVISTLKADLFEVRAKWKRVDRNRHMLIVKRDRWSDG